MKSKEWFHKVWNLYFKVQALIYRLPDWLFGLLIFLGICVYWIPAYRALYPGTFGYDGPVQMAQYFGARELTMHHPILHTYFMGMFFSLGERVFQSYTIGFAIYIAVQGMMVAAGFAYIAIVVKRRRYNFLLLAAGMLYTIRNPMVQMITFSSTKDVLFGVFLLLFSTELINPPKARMKGYYIRLGIWGVLMCLFRNQGIYLIVAILIFAKLFKLCKSDTMKCLVSVVVFVGLFNSIVTYGFDISKGNLREMLCVPMQQVSYVVGKHYEELTAEQLELYQEVIPGDGYKYWVYNSADDIKSRFVTDELMDNFGEHLVNYVELGLQYPKDYLYAWKGLIEGYWDTDLMEYRLLAMTYTFEELNFYGIEHAGLDDEYHLGLWLATQFEETPWKLQPEMCLWFCLILFCVAVLRRDRMRILFLLVYLFYFGTVILGPVALVRYIYPITIASPMLLALMHKADAEDNL